MTLTNKINSSRSPHSSLLTYVHVIQNAFEKLFATGAIISLVVLCCVVLLQIFARIFLDTPPVWTEELSRYLFILMIGLSVGVAYKRGELVSVELLRNRLSPINTVFYNIIVSLVLAFFCIILLPYAITFSQVGEYQLSPTMRFSMSYVFYCTVLILGNLALFSLLSVISNVISLISFWR